jgi:hypothetical protein
VKDLVKGILQVSNESLNEKYLRLPSDVRRYRSGAFNYLKDRVWKKIQGWIVLSLAAGGTYKISGSINSDFAQCLASNYLVAF